VAIDQGGERVRAAVADVFAERPSYLSGEGGLLPPEVASAVSLDGWREVIGPAGAALCAEAMA
jgi:hypothetical protein